MKLGVFNDCDVNVNMTGSNNFGFARFLTVFEIIAYYICIAIGMYNLYKLRIDPLILEDTFEISPELEF